MNNIIGIGWSEINTRTDNKEELKEEINEKYPGDSRSMNRIYLFTISENYGEMTNPQIICMEKSELEDFIEKNMNILPRTILDLIDMVDESMGKN